MSDFSDAAANQKNAISAQLVQLNARLTEFKKKKFDTSALNTQIAGLTKNLASVQALDVWIPRLKAMIDLVATKPDVFLDALTWHAFEDPNTKLNGGTFPLATSNRLTLILTTQDGQVTKTHWLSGKSIYGRSAGELIYRVLTPSGQTITSGYLTATASTGEFDFGVSGSNVVEDMRLP